MHRKINRLIAVLALLTMAATAGTAWAQDIKTRMRERLPVILDLKVRGVVGENNQGYLEMLRGQTEKRAVVSAENDDRRAIYAQIARATGAPVDVVGRRRAMQIAEKADAGEWLQDASGRWHRK